MRTSPTYRLTWGKIFSLITSFIIAPFRLFLKGTSDRPSLSCRQNIKSTRWKLWTLSCGQGWNGQTDRRTIHKQYTPPDLSGRDIKKRQRENTNISRMVLRHLVHLLLDAIPFDIMWYIWCLVPSHLAPTSFYSLRSHCSFSWTVWSRLQCTFDRCYW